MLDAKEMIKLVDVGCYHVACSLNEGLLLSYMLFEWKNNSRGVNHLFKFNKRPKETSKEFSK
jgi:hypothetical protein